MIVAVRTWPEDVDRYYTELARRRRWSPGIEASFRSGVQWVRALDESDLPRRYYDGVDPKNRRWLFETVEQDGEETAVRQLDIRASGLARGYWWQHIDDDDGALTDRGFPYARPFLHPITREQFYSLWSVATDDSA
jgi:hypothetical protein